MAGLLFSYLFQTVNRLSIITFSNKKILFLNNSLASQVFIGTLSSGKKEVLRLHLLRYWLISSGIVLSKLRSPAATWATPKLPGFRTHNEQAIVEFTSPNNDNQIWFVLPGDFLEVDHNLASLLGMRPGTHTPRVTSGSGISSSLKKSSRTYHDHNAAPRVYK